MRDHDRLGAFDRREGGTSVEMLGSPIRLGGGAVPRRAAPALGADTEAVLETLGCDSAAIAALRRDGVI